MAPLMVEMRNREIAFRYIDSGQHAETSRRLRTCLALPEPDVILRDEPDDIASIPRAISWYLKYGAARWFRRTWLKRDVFSGGGVCLIHGDTLSTLLGMQIARSAGLDVAHVESGLRSFRFWDPFPEELIRIRCMRRAQFLFAPSAEAAENLREMKVRGKVIEVPGNTVADSLTMVDRLTETYHAPHDPFVLATCHRLETISRRVKLEKVVQLLNRTAEKMPVVFVTHEPTRKYLHRFGLHNKLNSNVECRDLLEYGEFITLVKNAKMVLTDGGSIQEECGYLYKPCLILRSATERSDGIGANARLWSFDDEVANEFFRFAESFVQSDVKQLPRPSPVIVDALVELGFAGLNEK